MCLSSVLFYSIKSNLNKLNLIQFQSNPIKCNPKHLHVALVLLDVPGGGGGGQDRVEDAAKDGGGDVGGRWRTQFGGRGVEVENTVEKGGGERGGRKWWRKLVKDAATSRG